MRCVPGAQRRNTENLGDMRPVVGQEFYYLGLPLKITEGTAGPIRAVAIFPGRVPMLARVGSAI
jgi:kynurenine formamidase